MLKSTFNGDFITPSYGIMALNKFAETMVLLSEERKNNSLADYVDSVQACLIVLCKDLEENVDFHDCLSIIHNVYMYVATNNEKYREEIGDIIETIARKEKKPDE